MEKPRKKCIKLVFKKNMKLASVDPIINSEIKICESPSSENRVQAEIQPSPKLDESRYDQLEVPKLMENHEEEVEVKEKIRKMGFRLELTKDLIEEDYKEFLGSKRPIKRPRKISKASQEQRNKLLPGLWMESLIDY